MEKFIQGSLIFQTLVSMILWSDPYLHPRSRFRRSPRTTWGLKGDMSPEDGRVQLLVHPQQEATYLWVVRLLQIQMAVARLICS